MPIFGMKKKVLETGIDIGSSSIKYIQLSGSPDSPLLVNFGIESFSKGLEGSSLKALEDIAKRLNVKEVNISISGPPVVVRYIELPKMTDEELRSSMKFEAEKYIPFNINEVMLDCQRLEDIGPSKIRVLLTAAKKDAVNRRMEFVEKAGLTAKIIDCDSFAITNAFLLNFPDIADSDNTALLNLGDSLLMMNILKGKAPFFTREIELGGYDFTKALAEKMNINIQAASKLKEGPNEKLNEVMEIIAPIINRMVEEIKLSLGYYEDQVGQAVNKVYLSGGLSNFKKLPERLSENLGLDCKRWNPFKVIKTDKGISLEELDKKRNQLAVAVGLAIRR